MGMPHEDILEFQGEYRWLSNFWACTIVYEGLIYPSVEHAYVAAKSLDLEFRQVVANTYSPGKAKRLGRKVAVRDDWEEVKQSTMSTLIIKKFFPGGALAEKLMGTGLCRIVEGNKWGDTLWGVCDGVGENKLGKILMMQRAHLFSML